MTEPNQADKDQARLAKAKLVLSGSEKKEDWGKDIEYLAKRKEEAAKALASQEQIKIIEATEKERKDRIAMQKKMAELEQMRHQAEALKGQRLAKEQSERDLRAEQERQAKISQIIQSKEEIEKIKDNTSSELSPIKTLTRDTSLAIKQEGLSASRLVLNNSPESKKSLFALKEGGRRGSYYWLIGLGLIVIITGLSIGAWSLIERQEDSLAVIKKTRTGLIFTDDQKALDLNGKDATIIRSEIQSSAQAEVPAKGSLREIYFVKDRQTDTPSGLEIKLAELPLRDMLKDLGLPDGFTRFLGEKGLMGIYYGDEMTPFYLFKTTDYKNLANTLLTQEGRIIGTLLSLADNQIDQAEIEVSVFQDKMIKNYDARVVTDAGNNIIGLYSWLDKETVIVTSNENGFGKVLERYISQ